jgi:hypothetical protein
MLSKTIIKFLLHPIALSLPLTFTIFLLAPPMLSKYRIRTIEHQYISGKEYFLYEDLDDDLHSEKIKFDLNEPGMIKIQVYSNKGVHTQSNIRGERTNGRYFYFNDYNADQVKELFLFTFHNDSIFLHIIDLLSEKPDLRKQVFIDTPWKYSLARDLPEVHPFGLTDPDRDGSLELVFSIITGFSKQPRNIYTYNIRKQVLLKSTESGASVMDPRLIDLDQDSFPEIIFNTLAVGNLDSLFPYTDQYSWLMVLDKNLDFLFNPVKFREYPCHLLVAPVTEGSINRLMVFNDYSGTREIPSVLSLYDIHGELMKSRIISDYDRGNAWLTAGTGKYKGKAWLVTNREMTVELLDTGLSVVKRINGPPVYSGHPLDAIDADGDGRTEYFYKGNAPGLYYIVRDDFSDYTVVTIHADDKYQYISQVFSREKKPQLSFSFENNSLILDYGLNPWYRLKYILMAGVYLVVSALIWLVFLLQRYRARLQYETTRKITELQMKAVKNQIDPHFTLNILNSIGSLYATEHSHEKADYLFGKYARLLRQTVLRSDKIEASLQEELEFVKNYLDLEKFRLNDKFSYEIVLGEGVNPELTIPRLLIHTFAENAVKYAFRPMEGKGLLEISVLKQAGRTCIIITDNGPGMDTEKKDPATGTGKGLEIINEMIGLYDSLKGVKIKYTMENILEGSVCGGARVVVEILG